MLRLEGSVKELRYDLSVPPLQKKAWMLKRPQRISIAMCTYNGERYLREQLDSIAAQTRLPDEMVICDDGSTDATPEIVDGFARSVSFPVRFIRNPENLGSTKNFEKAISLSTGDLIALCDQDDIWQPEKLALQAELLERDPTLGGVFSDALLINDRSELIGKKLWASLSFSRARQRLFLAGHVTSVLVAQYVVTGATLMFRASLRTLFLPIPRSWVHDAWISWMLAVHSKLTLIKNPLVRYRLHANQQIGVTGKLTFRKRLQRGKQKDPAKHLFDAALFGELERYLIARNDAISIAALPALRQKIRFLRDRANQHGNRVARLARIAGNVRKYHRYDRGWKIFFRDILIVFV